MKNRRRTTTRTKRPSAPKVRGRRKPANTNVDTKNALLKRERNEALEQQKATAEVLRIISASPGDLKPVFDAMLANAVRLCDAKFGNLFRYENETFEIVAHFGVPPTLAEFNRQRGSFRPSPGTRLDRMLQTRDVVRIADDLAEPTPGPAARFGGARSHITVPMLKEDVLIGAITVYRQEVRPFTDKQIDLVKNFAAQAVIAIENTRLLNELRESLQQQTATADVFKVISSSPGELEPVFQAMLENATQICQAQFGTLNLYDGSAFRTVALHNPPPQFASRLGAVMRPHPESGLAHVARTSQIAHIDDLRTSQPYLDGNKTVVDLADMAGARTLFIAPMLNAGKLIGAISIYRQEVRPFTDKQIELVQNFAAQAVIAIENGRLLNELRQRTADLTESLEQQTATSEVLKVISSSPSDLQPIFATILENATRICAAKFGTLFLSEGNAFRVVAMHNAPTALAELRRRQPVLEARPGMAFVRSTMSKRAIQIADITEDQAYFER